MAKRSKTSRKKPSQPRRKPFPLAKVITAAVILAAAAALTVFLVIQTNADNARFALKNTRWISQSARTASGDEADIRDVAGVRYSNYQARLSFDNDSRFELWIAPGDADDGTHKGTYTLGDDGIEAAFDNGAKAHFDVIRSGGTITRIDVAYDTYIVSFAAERTES